MQNLSRQLKRVKNMSGSEPDFERQVKIKMELEEKQKSYMEDTLLHIGVENDFKMSKCSSKTTDSTSNMSLSLMREELQSILKKKDKFTRDEKCSYSDVVINVTFNSDVFGTTDKYIKNEQGEWVKHEVFNSLDCTFNVNRPVDTTSAMEEMKMQRDMGAISIQTIIENSKHTSNTALELDRLAEEKESNKTPIVTTPVPENKSTEEVADSVSPADKQVIDDKVD